MATIIEDYVSFEIAKLLKEKGFNECCRAFRSPSRDLFYSSHDIKNFEDRKTIGGAMAAPTLQMAMKWLREVHNIHIELNWEKGNQLYSFQIWKPGKFQPEISSLDLWRIYKDDNYLGEWIYEQACNEAIKYCLENLI